MYFAWWRTSLNASYSSSSFLLISIANKNEYYIIIIIILDICCGTESMFSVTDGIWVGPINLNFMRYFIIQANPYGTSLSHWITVLTIAIFLPSPIPSERKRKLDLTPWISVTADRLSFAAPSFSTNIFIKSPSSISYLLFGTLIW